MTLAPISADDLDVILGRWPFRIHRDPHSALPFYTVRKLDIPEFITLTRGRAEVDTTGRRLTVLLFDDSVLGFGDAFRNNERTALSIHRTMNIDVSAGYAVPSPSFLAANSTSRTGAVTGLAAIDYDSNPALVYTVGNRAVRLTPGGTETVEQTFSYNVSDTILFDGRFYVGFDDDDNIWRRTVSGSTVTWDRQAGTTTSISTESIAASSDDIEETTAGGLGSASATTIRTGRLTNSSTTLQVGQSSDDARQSSSGTMILDGTSEVLGTGRYVGLRFTNLAIARGATIVSATLTVELNGAANGGEVAIAGFAQDNTATFTTTSYDITSRPATTSVVIWTAPAGGAAGDRIQTADISSIVQEIVNRSGWASGNAIGFVLQGHSTNVATIRMYDNAAADAAELSVTFRNDAQAGLRFTTVPVPTGVIINSASIKLQAQANDANTVTIRIYGVAADNPSAWDSTNKPSDAATTTNFVDWSQGSVVANTDYTSSDISDIVQEIVDRAGWAQNNAMAFVLRSGSDNDASEFHTWYSFDDAGSGNEPRLDITYSTSSVQAVKARRFGVVRDALYRAYSNNKIAKCPSGLSPMASDSWSAPTGVGSSSTVSTTDWAVNWIGGVGDQLLVAKPDGIYRFNEATGRFDNLTPELASSAHTDNGSPCFVWKNVLFYPLEGGRLLAYDGARVDDVSPLRGTRASGDTIYGRITAFTGDDQYLYVATEPFAAKTQTGVNISLDVTTDNGSTYTSFADEIADDDPTTTATLTALDTVSNGDWFVVGADVPFMGIYFVMGTANTTAATMATLQYWNGSAWANLSSTRDLTSANSATLGTDGAIYWLSQPSDWAKSTINSKSRYWVRLSPSVPIATCTVAEIYIIPAREGLPGGTNTTLVAQEQAGLLCHILRGRLRRTHEDIENSIVWTDVWALDSAPIEKMLLTTNSLGFRRNSGPILWAFSRDRRWAITLPHHNNALMEPYYMSKNADPDDTNTSANILYLPAVDVGFPIPWHSVRIQGRNIQGDDLVEAWYRTSTIEYDALWQRLDQSAGAEDDAPIEFRLPSGVSGRYFELALSLNDNDNNDREPPIITRVTATAALVPDKSDFYEFTIILESPPASSGLLVTEITPEELWAEIERWRDSRSDIYFRDLGRQEMRAIVHSAQLRALAASGQALPVYLADIQLLRVT